MWRAEAYLSSGHVKLAEALPVEQAHSVGPFGVKVLGWKVCSTQFATAALPAVFTSSRHREIFDRL